MRILSDFYKSQWFLIVVIGLGIYVFVTVEVFTMYYVAHGQEVNSTNSTLRPVPNCEFIYCQPDEVTRPEIESDCFTKNPYGSQYFGDKYTRCVLD